MHSLNDPSFFLTNTAGAAYKLLLFEMIPHFKGLGLISQFQSFGDVDIDMV